MQRLLRKALLAYAARQDPQRLLERSRDRALVVAREAARVSRAYQTLLREAGIDPRSVGPGTDLSRLPVLTKDNTFGRFSIDELARPFRPADIGDVLTSSGRGGKVFGFKLTTHRALDRSAFSIDLGLQHAFNVDEKPTLLVNCLPMGVVFRSRAVTVANVSVREDMACAILRDLGPKYAQTIVVTDPLFVRRLLDHARDLKLDWRALNTSMILGEETLVEEQRDYICGKLGIDPDDRGDRLVASSFGVGELGLNLLFESRETIALRRAARRSAQVADLLHCPTAPSAVPGIFHYDPRRVHVEVNGTDDRGFGRLCFTVLDRAATIPLPRFVTGDVGLIPSIREAADAAKACGVVLPKLPLLVLAGRDADRGTRSRPSVEDVKALIYGCDGIADLVTGAFTIEIGREDTASVLVQANTNDERLCAIASRELRRTAIDRWGDVGVVLLPADLFPGRPLCDYERKASYRARVPAGSGVSP